jgi:hypothetical protein
LKQVPEDLSIEMVPGHAAQPSRHRTEHARHQTTWPQPWRKVVAVALFLVLALIALLVAGLGVSGLFAQMAYVETERSGAAAARIGAQEVGRIEQHLFNSLRYAPGNPWTLEQMGVLDLAKMRASTVPR